MIRSTFAGFSTAQLAMAASQKSLDVVGQNIANMNTPGYTRQRLDLQSISPSGHSQWNSLYSTKVGQGVMMTSVSQIRDPFLDIQYRNQLTETGTADAMDTILSKIGEVFDETSRDSIRNALNNVVSQLENMSNANNAGQDTSDKLVRSAMEVLLNIFHDNAESVKDIETELIGRLEGTESQKIQSYLDKIVELNKAIKSSQVMGSPALELQDQRNSLIDELATYLPINISYKQVDVGGNTFVETLKITFKDSQGNEYVLVDDSEKAEITIGSDEGMPPLSISIKDAEGKEGDITDTLGDGVLKGYVDMLNKSGIYDGTDVKGIGYYGTYFDNFVDTFAKTLNKLNMDAGGGALFETSDGNAAFTAENIRISEGWMNGTVKIETTAQEGAGDTDNSSANDNVLKMIHALTTDKWKFTNADGAIVFEGNFFDAYDHLQNTQASERSSVSTILESRVTVLNQIANSKDSVSGVSLDEEVMNLMKYQQSYNAAARLMTTLDEALDTLINNTGVVGR